MAAWSERLLAAAFLSSVLGAPVEAGAGSAVLGAVAAPRSCGVLFPELVVVMAAPSLVWGLRWPSPRCLAVLLLKIFRSLLVGCCSSSVDAVGFAEDGGRLRSCLRRETATARWRRLDADFLSSLRFCCLRQMDHAALQQGWSRCLLGFVVCVVDPCFPSVGWILLAFVRVCSFCS